MKKILYLSFLNEDIRPGYKRKIHEQATAFSNLRLDSYLLIIGNNGINFYKFKDNTEVLLNTFPFKVKRKKLERNLWDEFFLFKQFCQLASAVINEYNPNYLYIRRIVPITLRLLNFLKSIRKKNITIIYEYPTWPWKNEIISNPQKTIKDYLFYIIDLLLFNKLEKSVDFVTYIGTLQKFKKKYIKINNCGNIKSFPIKSTVKHSDINLIGMAQKINYWNGYDLLIESLNDYYQTKPDKIVNLYLLGDGDYINSLRCAVKKYNLEEHIKFLGYRTGDELNKIFDKSDIGINYLRPPINNKGNESMTTLKTIEYTFRGLPQISPIPFEIDSAKSDTPGFLLLVKKPLNILDIIEFYTDCKYDANYIRSYAQHHMSWESTFKNLFIKLENENSSN